jgi:hypothetical protein
LRWVADDDPTGIPRELQGTDGEDESFVATCNEVLEPKTGGAAED